ATVQVAPAVAAGKVAAVGAVSSQAGALADATLKALTWAKIKIWAIVTATLGIGATVAVLVHNPGSPPTSYTRRTQFQAHLGNVFSMAFSPDGKTLATGGLDKKLNLWDVATGKAMVTDVLGERNIVNWVADIKFAPDGKSLAACNGFQGLWLIDANS